MKFEKKDWEKVCPSDCKWDVISKPCADWDKHCPGDLKKIAADKLATVAASKMIVEMDTKLKTALVILSKSNDAKKASATKSLVEKWRKAVADYKEELKEATDAYMKEKVVTFVSAVKLALNNQRAEVEKAIAMLLDNAEKALEKNDVNAGQSTLKLVRTKVDAANTFLKGFPKRIQGDIDEHNLTEVLKLSEFDTGYKALEKALKKETSRAAELETELASLSDNNSTTEKNVETVREFHSQTLKGLKGQQSKAQLALATCKQFPDNPLIEKNPVGLLNAVSKRLADIDDVRETAEKGLESLNKGKYARLRQRLPPDQSGPFESDLTEGRTIHQKLQSDLSDAVACLKTALVQIASGTNEEAAKTASELIKKL